MPGPRDLSNTSVFLDFDGTITVADVGVRLLDSLADPGWRALDVEYEAGRVGSRDCMVRQWAFLRPGVTEHQLRTVAAEVPLDDGFGPLVDGLRERGAEITVVSDGYGFYVHDAIAPWNLPVVTNGIDFATGELWFAGGGSDTCCSACGTCKPGVIRAAAARGRRTVFIGDGISDRYAAAAADEVFAKASLAAWCAEQGIAHTRFDTLSEVASLLWVHGDESG